MKKKYTKAQKKLAIDWALGKLSHAEVARKLKKTSVGAYVALALMLRAYIQDSNESWS
jgi:hypothetical protein